MFKKWLSNKYWNASPGQLNAVTAVGVGVWLASVVAMLTIAPVFIFLAPFAVAVAGVSSAASHERMQLGGGVLGARIGTAGFTGTREIPDERRLAMAREAHQSHIPWVRKFAREQTAGTPYSAEALGLATASAGRRDQELV